MTYEDLMYSQYTDEQLKEFVSGTKSYLDFHIKRSRLEIIKRQSEQQETIEL